MQTDDSSWSEHWENLERVTEKIAPIILAWWDWRIKSDQRRFHMEELRRHVIERVGQIAPNSTYRIMYDLRVKRLINYVVVNRRESLYEILDVPPPPRPSPEYDPGGQGLLF